MDVFKALLLKEMKVFLKNRSLSFIMLAYTPFFVFFFGVFVYPYMVPPEHLAEEYKYGVLFVVCYPLLVSAFMNLGYSIVLDELHGVAIKLASLPIARSVDALGKLIAQLSISVYMILSSIAALAFAAYLRGVTPTVALFGISATTIISVLPIYFAAVGITLPVAAAVKGRVQIYNAISVTAINLIPFASGMFIPLFFFPKALQAISLFNPFSTAFYLYSVKYGMLTYHVSEARVLGISYAESIAILVVGILLYRRRHY